MNWSRSNDAHGIEWLTLDQPNVNANVISKAVIEELGELLEPISTSAPTGLVLASGKANGFAYGADVNEFASLDGRDQVRELIALGQNTFARIAALNCPSVAVISGMCIGGGLELALACTYRIADLDPKTKLGLPEVMLGIHPGYGGLARLPHLIDPTQAMDMILSGRNLDALRAKRLGLVDLAVADRHLQAAARDLLLRNPGPRRQSLRQRLLNTMPARRVLKPIITKRLAARANPQHYPAPYAALECWVEHAGEALNERLQAEQKSILRLAEGTTPANLIRVFELREQLKAQAKRSNFQAQHVHVIGAGSMGGDIAAWCAMKGITTTLQDLSNAAIGKAIGRGQQLISKRLRDRYRRQAAADRLIADPAGDGVRGADLIIEAVVEDSEVKCRVFEDLEQQAKPTAILATNTSSIPLEKLTPILRNPERLIGIHFFNPVAKMPLVEVVVGEQTSDALVDDVLSAVAALGKLPVKVTSTPGFLVNRVLTPYMLEAVTMLQDRITATEIDHAAELFGMPMGPLELADTVGLDVCLAVAQTLEQSMALQIPQQLHAWIKAGRLGKKTQHGVYSWKHTKPIKPKLASTGHDLSALGQRLVSPLIREAQRCLEQGVAENADLVDAAIIFGTGFAPFRGGPLHYVNSQ